MENIFSQFRSHSNVQKKYKGARRHLVAKLKTRFGVKLYIPTLLIMSFVLLMIVPDIVVLTRLIIKTEKPTLEFLHAIWIVYMISLLSDVSIYIFLQNAVYRELLRRIRNITLILRNNQKKGGAFSMNSKEQTITKPDQRANKNLENVIIKIETSL